MKNQTNSDTVVLRRKQVEKKTGLKTTLLYSKFRHNPKRQQDFDPTFTTPIKLGNGRAVGWIEAEVEQWLSDQINKSRQLKENNTL